MAQWPWYRTAGPEQDGQEARGLARDPERRGRRLSGADRNGLATGMTLVAKSVTTDPCASNARRSREPSRRRRRESRSSSHGLMCTETIWEMADGTATTGRGSRATSASRPSTFATTRASRSPTTAPSSRPRSSAFAGIPSALEELVPSGTAWGAWWSGARATLARLEKRRWLSLVRRAIYVGTPHLGAPLERARPHGRQGAARHRRPVHAARGRARRPSQRRRQGPRRRRLAPRGPRAETAKPLAGRRA